MAPEEESFRHRVTGLPSPAVACHRHAKSALLIIHHRCRGVAERSGTCAECREWKAKERWKERRGGWMNGWMDGWMDGDRELLNSEKEQKNENRQV